MAPKTVVHVVDDEEELRRSAAFLLGISGYAVTTWSSGISFLKGAKLFEPGCVLLDIHMPRMTGLEVQTALRDRGVTMPVIVLTGYGDIKKAVEAMKAGAVDFLEKPFEKVALLRAIEAGFRRLESDGGDDVRRESTSRVACLTPREREVLHGLARGLPNKAIAYDLNISPRTVELHRANMMAKLEVKSLSDALRLAFAAGIGV